MTDFFEGFDLTTFWVDEEYADENYTDEPLTDEMIASVEAELGVRIPASYIALMKTRNGGIPRDDCFPTQVPTSWAEDHVAITGILGIGREQTHSLCGELGNKFMLEEWGYPDIGICICDCPSAGHDMIMLDYRKCGSQGEPEVVHVDQESDYRITFLAKDFETFIRGLVNGSVYDDSDEELSKDLLDKIDEKNSCLDFDSEKSLLDKGKSKFSLFLNVFWKVMAVTAVLFFLLFFTMHYDDLTGPVSQVMFAVVYVSGYCLFYAFWVGLIAGIFAIL